MILVYATSDSFSALRSCGYVHMQRTVRYMELAWDLDLSVCNMAPFPEFLRGCTPTFISED